MKSFGGCPFSKGQGLKGAYFILNSNAPYWIVKKVTVQEMYSRKIQWLKVKVGKSREVFTFHIPWKIDISNLEKNDVIQFELSVRSNSTLRNPQFYISGVMLLNEEEVKAIDERYSNKSPLH